MRCSDKDRVIELLEDTPIVSAVSKKLNISRQTIYRWCKEDRQFKKKFDLAIGRGRDNINDLAESKLIEHIRKGNMGAVRFWLQNNKTNYSWNKSGDFRDVIRSELVKTKIDQVIFGERPCD